MGMLVQFIIALFVLRTGVGYDIFSFISLLARELLGFAGDGVVFLTNESVLELGWFLTNVIPAIIFFVAFVQMMYYWGVIQWFIGKFAVFFFWSMRVSGAEAVVAAATPFIGQGESAMLIKPFVPYLTKAEIHQIMSCGFATIAGSVLIAYINLGLNAQVLVSSCIMSIPASLALSHLRYPEEEETLTAGKIVVPKDETDECANVLEALAKGAWLGIKIAGMIVATLLVIIALLNLVSGLLTWWGRYIGLHGEYDLTVELIVGYIFYPIAFLLGVPRRDILHVARLIGLKVVAVSDLLITFGTRKIDVPLTFFAERVPRFHHTRQRVPLHRNVRSLEAHCDIQSLRLWKHWLPGYTDRCALTDRPGQDRRRCRIGGQRADHRYLEHAEQCCDRGSVGSGRGCYPSRKRCDPVIVVCGTTTVNTTHNTAHESGDVRFLDSSSSLSSLPLPLFVKR
jgi:nucleoside transporter